MDDAAYRKWAKEFDTLNLDQWSDLERALETLPTKPRIAVAPCSFGNPTQRGLHPFVTMLQRQIYKKWHICLSQKTLFEIEAPVVVTNSETLATLLQGAARTADFVLPLPLDAQLPAQALAHLVLALGQFPQAAVLYGDEDILQDGKRRSPCFKTDWDSFLMLGRDLIGTPALYSSQSILCANLSDLPGRTIENFLYALALRIVVSTPASDIVHVPAILCHRTAPASWNADEGRKTVAAYLESTGVHGARVTPAPMARQWNRVRFPLPAQSPVASIVIPTRDRAELIGPCIEGVLNRTDYPTFEVLIIDNGTSAPDALSVLEKAKHDSRVKVFRDDRPFNYSLLMNEAAAKASGEILVFLNNDTDVTHSDWLAELISLAIRPEVGLVGAELVYPDSRIQHAGVVFGPDSGVHHQFRLMDSSDPGPGGELALLRSVSAVTGACVAMRRELYIEIGGLNETDFPINYNDIEICMRIRRAGLAVLWTPFAKLIHYESASLGALTSPERADRMFSEHIRFWELNPDFYDRPDPFHNPQTTCFDDHVKLASPPRFHPLRLASILREPSPKPFFY